MDQNIEIAIRIKPCNSSLIIPTCNWDSESIQVTDRNIFTFDSVIDPEACQEAVFDKVGMRIISNILEGYNECIFAYGQTGSGKTYTMTGDQENEGLVQKCLRKLWNCVRNSEFFEIKLGYFEIYNEIVKDLLSNQKNLTIREHAKTGYYIENLTEKIVEKYEDFQELMRQRILVRTAKETSSNSKSSRSHSVLEVSLAYKRRENALMVLKHAKLTFIDLAGSQKQKDTKVAGLMLREAANINKSLSTLSLVISKLSEQSQRESGSSQAQVHIPFRNSVLTKILKNSLTGKSKITIICTVSLQERFIDETVSTLRFAQMAKSVKMKVNKNEEQFDGTKERLLAEFASVKQRMTELDEINKDLSKENEDLKSQNARIKDELEKKETELSELEISMECMKIKNMQIIQEIKTSSQVPPQFGISQSHPYNLSESQFPQNYSNNRSSQVHKTQLGRQKSQYPNNQNYFQNFNLHQQSQFFSQLSPFKSNIFSDGNSPKNSLFTIQEEDSRTENSGEDSKKKTQEKIKELEIELQKIKVENEFLKFYRDLQESEIAELIKNSVFLKAKEDEIEEATQFFNQLLHSKSFDHAQLKFMEGYLKKSQKDKTALNLATQEKKQQKQRFNQTTEKIKDLLIAYVENKAKFQLGNQIIHQNFMNRRGSQIFGSPEKREKPKTKNFIENFHEVDYFPFSNDFEIDGFNQWCQKDKNEPNYFQKKQLIEVEESSQIKVIVTSPVNSQQKVSQIPFFQNTQVHNSSLFQSSQKPMFMLDSRQLLPQAAKKLSNNQLEYLKKDYERMARDVKNLKGEIQKNKVSMIEKDVLLGEKTREIEDMKDNLKMLERELETQRQLVQIERNITNQLTNKKIETSNFATRSKQLTQKQYIEVIQKKKLESMYQAASYFYKKSLILEDSKRSFEEKIIFLQKEINQSVEKQRVELQKMDHDLVDAKKSALNHQEAVIDLKKEIVDLQKELYDKQKLIDDLYLNEKRVKEYSHLLETKLKEKNQKQLSVKETAHNLSTQLRDDAKTPNYAENNKRFKFGKNRYISDSGDSLVSNGDTPVVLNEKTESKSQRLSSESRKSAEKLREKNRMDEIEVLRSEIMEVENDMEHDSYAYMTENVNEGTDSIVSHTVTNKNEENPMKGSQNSFNLFSSNQSRNKTATTKDKSALNFFSNNNQFKR